MRRTAILMAAVLAVSLVVCLAGGRALDRAVDEAQRLRSAAILAEAEGRQADAKTLLLALAEAWKGHRAALETLASHDALHEVQAGIAEACVCLECEEHDDFLRILTNLDLALEHIRDEQALRWENLY